jgi:beta-aspartyl-dipeptidase (metallo-type)
VSEPMLTLIENGEVYAPEPLGRASVLLSDRILKVGPIDRRALDLLGVPYEVIDATGCVVAPGLIDPHQHLLGGSGEKGFATQTPEIFLDEIVGGGTTTVVGCLGVDATTKTLAGLIARAKGLTEEGITAFAYTGGYAVPPTTLLGSVREDILFIAEMIGAGEVAVADERATEPDPHELARLVSEAHAGGMLAKKAGVTHFHVGPGRHRLRALRAVLDGFEVSPSWMYPTHVERSEELVLEAIDLTRRGCTVDMDTVEKDLHRWLRFYLDHDGDPAWLTVSSDASITSPRNLHGQIRSCVVEHGFPLELVLPLVTSNTARVLKLDAKGRISTGADADAVVLDRRSLEVRDVIAGGKRMVRDGRLAVTPRFLRGSDREIHLAGKPE